MNSPLSPSRSTAAPESPVDGARATCPSCHTSDASLTNERLQAGVSWLCVRCGQRWDARRLETVAAYAAWAAEHDSAGQRTAADL